jgi:hypothetical protein
LFLRDGDGVKMRKPAAATVPPPSAAATSPDQASLRLVCLALTLALLVLAARIASVW